MSKDNSPDSTVPPQSAEPCVYIVDDEPAVRDAIRILLETEGLQTACFASGREFLEVCSPATQGCVLLDLCLPDYSGLDIQKILAQQDIHLPLIFLTGHGTVSSVSEAFRTGALDYLEKPFDNELLLQRVAEALHADAKRHAKELQKLAMAERYARLSEREKQVLQFVITGYSSKQMAKEMAISHRTVEIYRKNIMRKLDTETLIELMRVVAPLLGESGIIDQSTP